jgi:hypothetical protein
VPGIAGTIREAISDSEGRFTIENVAPKRECLLFTRMASLAARNLAAVTQEFRSADDGQITEVAELNLHPAHRVRVHVLIADDPQQALAVRVTLSRDGIPDAQEADSGEDGIAVLSGVPSESVALSFHSPAGGELNGYRLSPQNQSLDRLWFTSLRGRVDEDRNLVVLLERAPLARAAIDCTTSSELDQQGARLVVPPPAQGMRQQPNKRRPPNMNPLLEDERLLERRPLRGIPNEALSDRAGQGTRVIPH